MSIAAKLSEASRTINNNTKWNSIGIRDCRRSTTSQRNADAFPVARPRMCRSRGSRRTEGARTKQGDASLWTSSVQLCRRACLPCAHVKAQTPLPTTAVELGPVRLLNEMGLWGGLYGRCEASLLIPPGERGRKQLLPLMIFTDSVLTEYNLTDAQKVIAPRACFECGPCQVA